MSKVAALNKYLFIFALVGFLAIGCNGEAGAVGDPDKPSPLTTEDVSVEWLLNYEEAVKIAQNEGKIILLEFHGSDWCPPCIKLQKEVLSQDAFKRYAREKLVLVNLDFPRRAEISEAQRAHNQELAMKFGVQYFPTVILLNADGEVLDQAVGFPKGGLKGFLEFVRKHAES